MKIIDRFSGKKTYTCEVSFEEMFNICKEIGIGENNNAPKKGDVVILDTIFRNQKILIEEIKRLRIIEEQVKQAQEAKVSKPKQQLNG